MVDPIPAQVPPRSTTDFFSDPLDSHPLWFKPSLFLSSNFDSKSYISKLRTFVPFNTLRSKLESHCAALDHELIDLINRLVGLKLLGLKLEEYEAKPYYLINSILDSQVPIHDLFNVNSLNS
ncbi:conserved oligomeric golgi complex subunit 2 [Fagus crenata]